MKRARLIVPMALTLLVVAAAAAHGGTVYEFEIWCPDRDGDLDVDDYEINLVLDAWGPCPTTGPCEADLNGNGEVGTADLLRVYGNLGPCHCEGDLDGNGDRDTADTVILDDLLDSDLDCTPDLDHNATVNRYDEAIVKASMGCDSDSEPRADLDGDGDVDVDDLQIVTDALGRDCMAELTGDGNVDYLDMILLVGVANFPDSTCP